MIWLSSLFARTNNCGIVKKKSSITIVSERRWNRLYTTKIKELEDCGADTDLLMLLLGQALASPHTNRYYEKSAIVMYVCVHDTSSTCFACMCTRTYTCIMSTSSYQPLIITQQVEFYITHINHTDGQRMQHCKVS